MNTAIDTVNAAQEDVVYTARVRTTGGRDGGTSQSDDGRLDIHHSLPGTHGTGTSPEQLFAAGWSACFGGAMSLVAHKMKVNLPVATFIEAEVDLVRGEDGFSLRGRLFVHAPGVQRDVMQGIVEAAERNCPLSKATRGNIKAVIVIA